MRTIKLTRKQVEHISISAGWTPYWFETSHGIVNIPGPPDDDYYDMYEDSYPCGCCTCCGCDCDYYPDDDDYIEEAYADEIDDDFDYEYDEEEEE